MSESTICLHDDEVGRLLSGETGTVRSAELETHLTNCNDCRQRLEQQVGDDGWWDETESSLRSVIEAAGKNRAGDAFDDAGLDTYIQDGLRGAANILDLLGPTDDPNMLGRVGPYEIIGLLGQGGMGAVFKGFDRSLNRFVAIKMLLPHLAASGAARKRFAREGQAVAAVVDDHVMAIHCVDHWQGIPYLVMTYSRGVSLQKRLSDNGPLQVREILRIGMQAAKGLDAAHGQGIVHRDIKPANILLDQNVERVQLMDFGLARAVDDASLTRSGTLAGTPQYMSPEQARAETVDHRSDLFSLGSVLYAMCTGHAPFRAESSYSVLRLITDKEPRPTRELNPDIPEWMCAIIGKLMAKQSEDRFASADEVAGLLEECLAHVQQPTTTPLPDPVAKLVKRFGVGNKTIATESLGSFRLPPITKLVAAAAFAFSVVFAGVLIVLELNKGTLTIESDVDDVQIRVTRADQIVDEMTVTKSGETIRVSAGEYIVAIVGDSDGLTIHNGRVTLHRADNEVVRIVHSNGSDRKSPHAKTDAQHEATVKPVEFVLGKSNLAKGDQVEIQSVTTSGQGFEVGATVTVKGTYTLSSQDTASLCFFSTINQKAGEMPVPTTIQVSQRMKASRGKHTFTLSKVIRRIGSPHVSFYHQATGNSMGGVYFSEAAKVETETMPKTSKAESNGKPSDSLSTDGLLARLQGDWSVVQEIRNVGTLERHRYTAAVRGTRMKILGGGMHVVSFDLAIGIAGPPPQIDMRLSDRDRQEWLKGVADNNSMNLIYYGIIESFGNTFRICNHTAPGNPRPTEFTDTAGYGIWNFSRPKDEKTSGSPSTQPGSVNSEVPSNKGSAVMQPAVSPPSEQSDDTQTANHAATAQPKGKQMGTVLGKPVYEGEFNSNVDLEWNVRNFFIDPVEIHYLKEQGIDPEEDLRKRIPDDNARRSAVIIVRRLVLQEHLYRKFGGRVCSGMLGPHAFDAYQMWLRERREAEDFELTDPAVALLVDGLCTKVPENIRWASPEQIEEGFEPASIEKFVSEQAIIPAGAHKVFNYPLVGDVLSQPVRMPRVFADVKNNELPKLLHNMFVPLLTENYRKQHPELEPTEEEIAAWIVIRKQQFVRGWDHDKKRIAELDRMIDQGEKGMREFWEHEKEVLETKWQLSGARGDDTKENLRVAAIQTAGWIKFQKHLHDTYGGGRLLLHPQIIAFDAQQKWLEHREKLGEFQIPDSVLRTKFYDYWKNGAAVYGDKLTDDPDRLNAMLEPAWLLHGDVGTAAKEVLGKNAAVKTDDVEVGFASVRDGE